MEEVITLGIYGAILTTIVSITAKIQKQKAEQKNAEKIPVKVKKKKLP